MTVRSLRYDAGMLAHRAQDAADAAALHALNTLADWVNSKGHHGLAQDMLDTFGTTAEAGTTPKPPGPANAATLIEGEH